MSDKPTQDQIRELTADFEFLKAAATTEGFTILYFKGLKNSRTQIECFNNLNDRYFDLIGEYKYSDYDSFRHTLKRLRKKDRK